MGIKNGTEAGSEQKLFEYTDKTKRGNIIITGIQRSRHGGGKKDIEQGGKR